MELLTPGIGLIFWQTITFLIVFGILLVFVWKPITQALKAREGSIEDALKAAELAREEIAQLKADNEILLQEAREERDKIIKEAKATADRMIQEAEVSASEKANKILQDAQLAIANEKKLAMAEVKNMVGNLSLQITEKLLRNNLAEDKDQKLLVDKYIKELNIN